jgi:hypothetical protein
MSTPLLPPADMLPGRSRVKDVRVELPCDGTLDRVTPGTARSLIWFQFTFANWLLGGVYTISADLFMVYSEDGTRTVFSIRFTLYLLFWLLNCGPVYVEKLGKAPHALHPTGFVVDIYLIYFYFLL